MRAHPKVLRVEKEKLTLLDTEDGSLEELFNNNSRTPRLLHKIEDHLKLKFALCLYVRSVENQCDIVWAGSENIGLLLSIIGIRKPLIVIAHHMSSSKKARFARYTGIVKKWAGIGYINNQDRDFFIDYFGVNPNQLFQYMNAIYLDKASKVSISYDGPILGLGVAKRDYNTLVAGLSELPDHETELFVGSKYGDELKDQLATNIPTWVDLREYVTGDDLIDRYRHARFVVVPLVETTMSAGTSVILEAYAFGKAVIATNTAGIHTLIKHGETGILVNPCDVNGWRTAIHSLWSQPELAKQMGQAGRKLVETHYNPKEVNARIKEFMRDLYQKQQR